MAKVSSRHILPRSPQTTLCHEERTWVHYQPFLAERGYMLRPRYRPWSGAEPGVTLGQRPFECEGVPGFDVLDAIRSSDRAHVVLKVIRTVSDEAEISAFLTNELSATRHTIQFLDLFSMYDDLERAFLVMPRMRWQCSLSPWFATVREFIEFVMQVLQGLVFLHTNNIAHRDICSANIVMDSSRMIPGGFHFVNPSTSDGLNYLREYTGDDSDPRLMKSRTQAGPIHYCFIDFGLSVRFPSFEARQLVTGNFGRLRKRVPEISATIPYDPFKVDVRLVGEMLRSEFLLNYVGLDFIVPLVKKLRRRNPEQRPDAGQALALFEHLVAKMSDRELEEPLHDSFWEKERRTVLFMKGLGVH
ncbi:kinase-like domain-containing protein [Mycena latifolia]|nr:kinase-like domain-containing protein [Mycena latifolia]